VLGHELKLSMFEPQQYILLLGAEKSVDLYDLFVPSSGQKKRGL
jgi:hypothetical protein